MRKTKQALHLWLSAIVFAWCMTPPAAAQDAHKLTLKEAIARGLASNLRVLAAGTRVDEAIGTRERRLANLLPRVRAEAVASLQNRNLRAFGLSAPGFPPVVPLFSTYEMRFYAEQPLFDRQSYHALKASEQQQVVAREEYQDIRDLIIRQVAGLYLNAQASAARAGAAQSRVKTAEELLRLARERRSAGVATGVDLLRAEVQLANESQRLLEARNETQQVLLQLARSIGLRPGTPIELADPLAFQPVDPPALEAALANSLTARADYRSLAAQREALSRQQKSSQARYLPKVSIGGDYGGSGRSFGEIRGTGSLRGGISVTLFDRDRKGEQMEISSRLRRLDYQLADLQLAIQQEVHAAMLDLDSAAEQVAVAGRGRELAQKELELARERFQSGVANNVEIVRAQDGLARAMENYILAVSRHSDAKMALARALGATERTYTHYLGIH